MKQATKHGLLATAFTTAVLSAVPGLASANNDQASTPVDPVKGNAPGLLLQDAQTILNPAQAHEAPHATVRHENKHAHKNKKHKHKATARIRVYNAAAGKLGSTRWPSHTCLQFTDDMMQAAGINPLRRPTAADAWKTYVRMGKAKTWGRGKPEPGDLVFWDSYVGGLSSAGHAAIYGGKGTVIENVGGVIARHSVSYAAPNHHPPSGYVPL